mgnify:CR=1 FL=1
MSIVTGGSSKGFEPIKATIGDTVALMEMAQAFRNAEKEGRGPKRSILFLHLTGEEIGKKGSEYYTSHPVFPLENTLVDLNIDMIGRVDEVHKNNKNYIYFNVANFDIGLKAHIF